MRSGVLPYAAAATGTVAVGDWQGFEQECVDERIMEMGK
jgi:hypothetical protein